MSDKNKKENTKNTNTKQLVTTEPSNQLDGIEQVLHNLFGSVEVFNKESKHDKFIIDLDQEIPTDSVKKMDKCYLETQTRAIIYKYLSSKNIEDIKYKDLKYKKFANKEIGKKEIDKHINCLLNNKAVCENNENILKLYQLKSRESLIEDIIKLRNGKVVPNGLLDKINTFKNETQKYIDDSIASKEKNTVDNNALNENEFDELLNEFSKNFGLGEVDFSKLSIDEKLKELKMRFTKVIEDNYKKSKDEINRLNNENIDLKKQIEDLTTENVDEIVEEDVQGSDELDDDKKSDDATTEITTTADEALGNKHD